MAYQSFSPLYLALYGTLKELLWLSSYYYLSVLYQVQADTIMELCERENYEPEAEYQKLRKVFLELRDLEMSVDKPFTIQPSEKLFLFRTTQQFNLFISPTIIGFGATSYAMVSISGIAILIQSKSGWLSAIAQSIVYPVYVSMLIGVWSAIGQMLSDSVGYFGGK